MFRVCNRLRACEEINEKHLTPFSHPTFLLATIAGLVGALGTPQTVAAFETRFLLDTYLAGHAHAHDQWSSINPDNQTLRLIDGALSADFRPDLRISTDRLKLVARPRWVLETRTWREGPDEERHEHSEGDFNLTDAYLEWKMAERFRLVTGLEVYQWGPAELVNASNPLFHLKTESRSPYFKEKGVALIRLSADATDHWNIMLIANPISNNEPAFRSDPGMDKEIFFPSGFLKTEITSAGQTSYIGLVGGTQPDSRPFFGEYLNFAMDSGWSFYIDSRHPIGVRHFVPRRTASGFLLMDEQRDDDTIESLALAGLRWEGRVDLRIEYFYNSPGYDTSEFNLALDSITEPGPYLWLNFARFLRPGLEVYGQHVLYLSGRLPDFGKKKDMQFALRAAISLQDGSAFVQSILEKPLSDSIVLNLEADSTLGNMDSEFTLLDRLILIAGVKWTL